MSVLYRLHPPTEQSPLGMVVECDPQQPLPAGARFISEAEAIRIRQARRAAAPSPRKLLELRKFERLQARTAQILEDAGNNPDPGAPDPRVQVDTFTKLLFGLSLDEIEAFDTGTKTNNGKGRDEK